ncbi:MAG TPA: hypothetical protein VM120_05330, partial [Bryobacteraceae bacterium]|nr:hypothetical protein [Bryobacteraceae bacterium]
MKLKLLLTAALAVHAQAAASFTLDATYTFTPLSGSPPTPHASSVREVAVATPPADWTYCGAPGTNGAWESYCPDEGYASVVIPTSQYAALSDSGAPTASEVTNLTNAIANSAITWAPSGYGFSSTGSLTSSTGATGHGALSHSNTVFSSPAGMAG